MRIRKRFAVSSSALASAALAGSRAFGAQRNLAGRPRASSFPFVSGDTFRSIADFVFDIATMREIDGNRIAIPAFPSTPSVIFVEFNVLDAERWRTTVGGWIESASKNLSGNVIIATNGDRAPRQLLEYWADQGNAVFAQNASDDFRGVTPIPIGLQNLSHMKSGVLDDFLLYRDALRQGNQERFERNNLVYANFNISNKPDERGELARLLKDSPYRLENRRVSPREFRRKLLTSKFVLSPPGAGPDCHRTWEALLLGAVPVVLRSSLADSLVERTGILAVDSWSDFFDLGKEDLLSVWAEKRAHPKDKALFNFWLNKINRAKKSLESRLE